MFALCHRSKLMRGRHVAVGGCAMLQRACRCGAGMPDQACSRYQLSLASASAAHARPGVQQPTALHM